MSLRIGSLFTGTGALDLAVMDVYDAEVVWHSQYEPPDKNGKEDKNQYAAKILARHWPETPNLGDITKVDWQAVVDEHGPVDIVTGGFPCQDVSSAGRRVGLAPDTRSGLWTHMAHAISILQPKLVVIENVEGLLSAPAASDLEPCPWCVGDGHAEPVLRACGAVLGDLASLGLHAEWGRFEASDVGAPHRRRRVIIRAWPAVQNTDVEPGRERRLAAPGQAESRGTRANAGGRGGTPAAHSGGPELEVGGVEPDGPQLPAAQRGRREPAADTHSVESERRGVAGLVGSQAAAELGEGDQRQRAGHTAGDSREAAADTDGRGREGHQERHGGPQQGQPQGERGLDAVGRGVRRAAVEPVCPTCGCGEWMHDAGGFCAGPCGGSCTDPELGRPGQAPADADDERAGEVHKGSHLLNGERQADRRRPVQLSGPNGDREAGDGGASDELASGRGSTAEQSADRRTVLELRDGEPDLDWGDYGPAIRRWERILGRRAPWPTDAVGRLSPVFTEWLMGLPDGWVTDTPGLTRAAMLRALGNGVVRQQAAAALRVLHARAAAGDGEAAA